jgi:hypothetical protein
MNGPSWPRDRRAARSNYYAESAAEGGPSTPHAKKRDSSNQTNLYTGSRDFSADLKRTKIMLTHLDPCRETVISMAFRPVFFKKDQVIEAESCRPLRDETET